MTQFMVVLGGAIVTPSSPRHQCDKPREEIDMPVAYLDIPIGVNDGAKKKIFTELYEANHEA